VELIQSTANILLVKAWRPVAAIAAAGLLLFQGSSAIAQDPTASFCPSEGTQPYQFASVVSGDAFFTVDNEEVRLAGVLAPGSGGNYASATTIASANAALNQAIGARALLLATTTQGHDRYGRVVAQVFVDGDWLQAALLQSG
jgi:endonuclease YncB( thermonuclease family)